MQTIRNYEDLYNRTNMLHVEHCHPISVYRVHIKLPSLVIALPSLKFFGFARTVQCLHYSSNNNNSHLCFTFDYSFWGKRGKNYPPGFMENGLQIERKYNSDSLVSMFSPLSGSKSGKSFNVNYALNYSIDLYSIKRDRDFNF